MFEEINILAIYILAIYTFTLKQYSTLNVPNKEPKTTDRYEKPKQTDVCGRMENIWDVVRFMCITINGDACEWDRTKTMSDVFMFLSIFVYM